MDGSTTTPAVAYTRRLRCGGLMPACGFAHAGKSRGCRPIGGVNATVLPRGEKNKTDPRPCTLPLLFVVPRVPFFVPFSFVFVLSSCRFPFDSCIAFRFYFRFPAFLGGGFCYSVISSRRYIPPALLVNLKYAYSPCVMYSEPKR